MFYLRSLLSVQAGDSYMGFKSFNGNIYSSYQEVAHAMGIFATETECVQAFIEAVLIYKTPSQLRFLFINMLLNNCIPVPIDFWQQFSAQLSLDYSLRLNGNTYAAESMCLDELNRVLAEHGHNLSDYGLPSSLVSRGEVFHELSKWFPLLGVLADDVDSFRSSMTTEQAEFYARVINAVESESALYMFLDGKAGTGKTRVLRAICNCLRAREKIVVTTATSAFAAQLYDGRRTTHSAFKVSVLNQCYCYLISFMAR